MEKLMVGKGISIFLTAVVMFYLTGCTSRAWYEGFSEGAKQKCYQFKNEDEIQQCLEEVDSTSYEEYRKSRQL